MTEGRITVDLFPAGGEAKIASSRPLAITRQFSGQRPGEVLRSVSLLFATCRAAQSIASAEAFEQALGLELPGRTRKARALLVLAETAREHALRILMDWPQFLRAPGEPQAPRLQRLMQVDRDLRHSLAERGGAISIGGVCTIEKDSVNSALAKLKTFLEQAIFAEDLDRWRTQSGLQEWARSGRALAQRLLHQIFDDSLLAAGAVSVSTLPQLHPAALAERLFAGDAERFIAKPEWDGQPRETSPLTRNNDHPLVEDLKAAEGFGLGARLIACLAELSQIPAQMLAILDSDDNADPAERAALGHGIGVAQIEAARGRLVHAVEMGGDTVKRYRILAPTEWNFHPEGAAAQGLANIAAIGAEDRATLARLFVTAVDPCVGVDVRVH